MIPQEYEQAPQDGIMSTLGMYHGPMQVRIYTKDNVQQILTSTHIQAKIRFHWMEGEILANECDFKMSFKLVK
jgi:hypothetical protein